MTPLRLGAHDQAWASGRGNLVEQLITIPVAGGMTIYCQQVHSGSSAIEVGREQHHDDDFGVGIAQDAGGDSPMG